MLATYSAVYTYTYNIGYTRGLPVQPGVSPVDVACVRVHNQRLRVGDGGADEDLSVGPVQVGTLDSWWIQLRPVDLGICSTSLVICM